MMANVTHLDGKNFQNVVRADKNLHLIAFKAIIKAGGAVAMMSGSKKFKQGVAGSIATGNGMRRSFGEVTRRVQRFHPGI